MANSISPQACAAWLRIMAGNELPGDAELWMRAYAEADPAFRASFERTREDFIAALAEQSPPEARH